MKKILRLVTTSVLTLTLVACGEASSSVSSSVNTGTSPSVPSVSSAYANVTSLTLSAASNLLNQVMGSQRTVTITGALNANTNPTLQLEWYVNGVKQAQTSRIFDFTPVATGSYQITSRVGNVVSNTLTITLGSPTLAASEPVFVNSRTIEVKGDAGATVTLVGAKLATSAFYSLQRGVYVLDLEEAVEQGTSVTVRMERAGFTTVVKTAIFDTTSFEVKEVLLGSDKVAPVNGVFQVVRPFDAGTIYNKTVTVDLVQRNLIPLTGTVNQVIEVTTPAGVKSVSTNAVDQLQDYIVTVTSTTEVGTWTFKITLGNKSQEFKVNILAPSAEILVDSKGYSYNDSETGLPVFYGLEVVRDLNPERAASPVDNQFATIITASTISGDDFKLPATLNANGVYVVERPFETFANVLAGNAPGTGTLHYFEFSVLARNFAKPEFTKNQLSVGLEGPTSFSATPTTLIGMELEDTTYPGNPFTLINATDFDTLNNISKTGGANETSAYHTIRQVIDRGTPLGTYTFTIRAGDLGKETVKTVIVEIVAPTPKLDFVLKSYETVSTQTRVHEVKQTSENVFEIQKPLTEGRNFNLSWYTVVKNLQSAVSLDFSLNATDALRNPEDRTLFDSTSGVKYLGTNAEKQNVIFVPRGVTNLPLGKLEVELSGATAALTAYTFTLTNAAFGKVTSSIKATADANAVTQVVDSLNVAVDSKFEIDLGTITVAADAVPASELVISIGSLTAANGTANIKLLNLAGKAAATSLTLVIKVADLNDVVSFGTRTFDDAAAFTSNSYNLINMSMAVQGPSDIFPSIEQFRAAVLLAPNKDSFVLVNQTAAQFTDETGLRLALEDKYLLLDTALPVPGDVFTGGGLNRPILSVNKATATGSYKLTFNVGGLSKEVTLVVKNSEPKIFVLSALEDDALQTVTKSNPVVGTGAGGTSTFSTTPDTSVKTPTYNLLKILNETGADAAHTVDKTDKFIPELNGEYSFFMPRRALTTDDILKAEIAIADLDVGEYNYSVTKKYPDGRVISFSDKALITSVNNFNLAVFDSTVGTQTAAVVKQNDDFKDIWGIYEPTYMVGTYEYHFSFGNLSKKIVVNVLDPVGFDLNSVAIGDVEASLFTKIYQSEAGKIGLLTLNFGLSQVTENDYFRISKTGTTAELAEFWTPDTGDTNFSTEMYSLKDLRELVIGNVSDAANTEVIILNVKFYKLVDKPFTGVNAANWNNGREAFDTIGETQVIKINILTAIS